MSYLRLGALAVLALVITSLVAAMFYYKAAASDAAAEAAQARANLAVAVDANKAQEATIGRLRATEAANAKAVAELLDEIEAIHKETAEANDAIQALEKQNADVAAYLGAAVPDDLKRLLDPQASRGH